jgi:hypothetical protein
MEIDCRNIAFLYNGDTMSEHEFLGLMGPSSTFPCPLCTVRKDDLAHDSGIHSLPATGTDGAALQTVDIGTMAFRTLEQMDDSHIEFLSLTAKEQQRAGAGASCGGAVRRCLPRTEIAGNVVPPVLHILMSAVGKAADLLREACVRRDSEAGATTFTDALESLETKHSIRRHSRFGTLTGGSATAIVSHWHAFGGVIGDFTDGVHDDRFMIGMSLFGLNAIEQLMMRPTPLCSHELDTLQLHATALAQTWHEHLPNWTVTPLMHMLFIDVPRFARLHGSVHHCPLRESLAILLVNHERSDCAAQVGMMSEQSLEKCHYAINQLSRKYVTMHPDEHRIDTTLRQSLLRAHPLIVPYVPPKRRFSVPRRKKGEAEAARPASPG